MGFIVNRGKDRWACVVYVGRQRGPDGKAKEVRIWRTVRGTKQDARALLRRLEEQHERHQLTTPRRQTLGEYLAHWIADVAPLSVEPSTLASYRMVVEKHLGPRLGGVRLDRLSAVSVNTYLRDLAREGRRAKRRARTDRSLAPETVRRHYRVLHKALTDAVREGVLLVNPAGRAHVLLPKRQRAEVRALNEGEALRFLDAVRASRLGALYELAVFSGMRQGELVGLRWADVNLDLGLLSVRQIYYRGTFKQPKTEKSRRRVELDDYLVGVLRQHQARQDEERRLFGDDYQDADLVFAQPDGRPLDGQSLTRNEFRRLLRQAGCPPITFHALRHTTASLHLAQGSNLKLVSELLGHSGVGITADLYSHLVPGLQRQATARLTKRLRARARRLRQAKPAPLGDAVAEPAPDAEAPSPEAVATPVH